jgi:hypothetical protein
MDWERILPLKIYYNFNLVMFLFNVVISISRLVKTTPVSHLHHTYAKLLKLLEVGLSTLILKDLVEDRQLPFHFVVVHQIVGCVKSKTGKVGTGIPAVCCKMP